MLKNEQPVINGDGEQTRDYVYVKDVAEANILALKYIDKVGIYNVGTSIEISVNALFEEINKNFNKSFKQVYGPAKQGEQKTSCLDIGKIEKDLGFKPKVNFGEGIKMTYEWFKEKKC